MGRFDKYLDEQPTQASGGRFAKYLDEPAAAVGVPPMLAREAPVDDSKPKKTPAQIQYEIDKGMTPEPGFLDKVGAALSPSEAWKDANAGAGRALDQATFGAYPYAVEKLGGPTREQQRAAIESRPGTELGGNLAGAGLMGASNVGAPFAAAGRNMVAPVVGAAERVAPGLTKAIGSAMPSARPITEAAVGSGVFGATDAAVRGGDWEDVGKSAGMSALVGGAASALPVAASKIEDAAHTLTLNRSVKPVIEVAKGKVDKALSQFGGGGGKAEEGARNLKEFVDKENLQPVLRQRGDNMQEQFEARKQAVWDNDLAPVYQKAIELEPKASVPLKTIKEKLSALVSDEQRGTSRSELVKKYISTLETTADAEGFGSNYPVRNLLNKARDYQGKGHSGVVNYDSPTESKELEREVGRVLRQISNNRIGQIYAKNPKAAAEVLGREPASIKRPRTIADGQENEDVIALGNQFRAGNERYSNYMKLDPLVEQAAKRTVENREGLIDNMKRGGTTAAGALIGNAIGGPVGAAVGGVTAYTGIKAAPLIERGIEAGARKFAGDAFNPLDVINAAKGRNLTKPEIAKLLSTSVGIQALKEYFSKRKGGANE